MGEVAAVPRGDLPAPSPGAAEPDDPSLLDRAAREVARVAHGGREPDDTAYEIAEAVFALVVADTPLS